MKYGNIWNFSEKIAQVKIYAKCEDLNYTGTHKLNPCIGEV